MPWWCLNATAYTLGKQLIPSGTTGSNMPLQPGAKERQLQNLDIRYWKRQRHVRSMDFEKAWPARNLSVPSRSINSIKRTNQKLPTKSTSDHSDTATNSPNPTSSFFDPPKPNVLALSQARLALKIGSEESQRQMDSTQWQQSPSSAKIFSDIHTSIQHLPQLPPDTFDPGSKPTGRFGCN
jgi:hypothetical protein